MMAWMFFERLGHFYLAITGIFGPVLGEQAFEIRNVTGLRTNDNAT